MSRQVRPLGPPASISALHTSLKTVNANAPSLSELTDGKFDMFYNQSLHLLRSSNTKASEALQGMYHQRQRQRQIERQQGMTSDFVQHRDSECNNAITNIIINEARALGMQVQPNEAKLLGGDADRKTRLKTLSFLVSSVKEQQRKDRSPTKPPQQHTQHMQQQLQLQTHHSSANAPLQLHGSRPTSAVHMPYNGVQTNSGVAGMSEEQIRIQHQIDQIQQQLSVLQSQPQQQQQPPGTMQNNVPHRGLSANNNVNNNVTNNSNNSASVYDQDTITNMYFNNNNNYNNNNTNNADYVVDAKRAVYSVVPPYGSAVDDEQPLTKKKNPKQQGGSNSSNSNGSDEGMVSQPQPRVRRVQKVKPSPVSDPDDPDCFDNQESRPSAFANQDRFQKPETKQQVSRSKPRVSSDYDETPIPSPGSWDHITSVKQAMAVIDKLSGRVAEYKSQCDGLQSQVDTLSAVLRKTQDTDSGGGSGGSGKIDPRMNIINNHKLSHLQRVNNLLISRTLVNSDGRGALTQQSGLLKDVYNNIKVISSQLSSLQDQSRHHSNTDGSGLEYELGSVLSALQQLQSLVSSEAYNTDSVVLRQTVLPPGSDISYLNNDTLVKMALNKRIIIGKNMEFESLLNKRQNSNNNSNSKWVGVGTTPQKKSKTESKQGMNQSKSQVNYLDNSVSIPGMEGEVDLAFDKGKPRNTNSNSNNSDCICHSVLDGRFDMSKLQSLLARIQSLYEFLVRVQPRLCSLLVSSDEHRSRQLGFSDDDSVVGMGVPVVESDDGPFYLAASALRNPLNVLRHTHNALDSHTHTNTNTNSSGSVTAGEVLQLSALMRDTLTGIQGVCSLLPVTPLSHNSSHTHTDNTTTPTPAGNIGVDISVSPDWSLPVASAEAATLLSFPELSNVMKSVCKYQSFLKAQPDNNAGVKRNRTNTKTETNTSPGGVDAPSLPLVARLLLVLLGKRFDSKTRFTPEEGISVDTVSEFLVCLRALYREGGSGSGGENTGLTRTPTATHTNTTADYEPDLFGRNALLSPSNTSLAVTSLSPLKHILSSLLHFTISDHTRYHELLHGLTVENATLRQYLRVHQFHLRKMMGKMDALLLNYCRFGTGLYRDLCSNINNSTGIDVGSLAYDSKNQIPNDTRKSSIYDNDIQDKDTSSSRKQPSSSSVYINANTATLCSSNGSSMPGIANKLTSILVSLVPQMAGAVKGSLQAVTYKKDATVYTHSHPHNRSAHANKSAGGNRGMGFVESLESDMRRVFDIYMEAINSETQTADSNDEYTEFNDGNDDDSIPHVDNNSRDNDGDGGDDGFNDGYEDYGRDEGIQRHDDLDNHDNHDGNVGDYDDSYIAKQPPPPPPSSSRPKSDTKLRKKWVTDPTLTFSHDHEDGLDGVTDNGDTGGGVDDPVETEMNHDELDLSLSLTSTHPLALSHTHNNTDITDTHNNTDTNIYVNAKVSSFSEPLIPVSISTPGWAGVHLLKPSSQVPQRPPSQSQSQATGNNGDKLVVDATTPLIHPQSSLVSSSLAHNINDGGLLKRPSSMKSNNTILNMHSQAKSPKRVNFSESSNLISEFTKSVDFHEEVPNDRNNINDSDYQDNNNAYDQDHQQSGDFTDNYDDQAASIVSNHLGSTPIKRQGTTSLLSDSVWEEMNRLQKMLDKPSQ